MASKRKSSVLNNVDEVIGSVPIQIDEVLTKLREKFSIVDEIISNAEQEAITIVTEAAQRMKTMTTKAEKRVEAMNKELADLRNEKQRLTEAINKVLEDLEEEKKRIANTHAFGPMLKIDVGGHLFTTTTATLTRFPDTMLGAMFSGRHALTPDPNGAYCIDRDGRHFHEILNFLRGSKASTKEQVVQRLSPAALEELKVEADFYGLKDLMFPIIATVRITGATGQYSNYVNGAYKPTDELSGDMPVYVKVGNSDLWLEYYAATKSWMVKSAEHKRKNQCWAFCSVPEKCLPPECLAGKWELHDGSKWVPQRAK